jgi:hypothetical protein
MSNTQRWSLLVLAVVVLVVGYFVLRPKDDDDDATATTTVTQVVTTDGAQTSTTETPPPTTTTPTTTTKPTAPPKPQIQTIRVKDGQPVGGVKELDFDKGDTIAFKVSATAPGGEVHFHGYDIAKEIPESGGSVTYKVPATIEGIFEVEMEATGVQIAKVVVQP